MQKFQYPQYLHLLWLLIPMLGLIVWSMRWREKALSNNFHSSIQSYILKNPSKPLMIIKWILLMLAFILLIIGIANPQIGVKEEKVKGKGIDVMILLDVSNSMLAQDIQPNRLERSKLFISRLIDNLNHDRVGLVIFAGNSFLQVPLTIDYSAIKMNLPLIEPGSMPSQGTNIGEAVEMAGASLGLTDSKHKAIVILTDGEDHDKEAEAAINEAKKNGIKVFAIGVGTEQGGPIPMNGEYKRDENGEIITTAFNRKMLETLASIGNGTFYELGQQSDIVEDVVQGLKAIEGKDYEDFDFSNYNSYFYWFLLGSLGLLFIYFLLPTVTLSSFFRKVLPVFFLVIIASNIQSQTKEAKQKKEKSQMLIRKGNVDFQNKKYQEAELNYRKSISENPKNATASYNLSNALYEQKKYKEAREYLEKTAKEFNDKPSKSKAFHNLGNAFYKEGNMEKAIENYENALKLNPGDLDTKFNLAMAKKEKKNQGGGGQNNQQQKQDQQKQQQKESDKGKESDQKKDGDQKDDSEQGQPKPKPGQMSEEEAQKLLEALKNQEQNTQKKVDLQRQKPEQKKHEKDW